MHYQTSKIAACASKCKLASEFLELLRRNFETRGSISEVLSSAPVITEARRFQKERNSSD